MNISLSKRNFVRIITFSVAIIAVSIAFAFSSKCRADKLELKLQNNYLSAITSLANSTDNIYTTLKKGIYAGSPEMLSELSSKLWHDSSIAKASLSQLPMGNTQLEKTYKFLSQVGNYSISIAEKATKGETLSLEEYTNLASLSEYSEQLKNEMWEFETRVQTGQINLKEIYDADNKTDSSNPPDIFEGFVSMEEGFESYPTLIYDGPFSDHLLTKEPEMLKNMLSVSQEDALKTAASASLLSAENLTPTSDENSKVPSYCFEGENTDIAITKNGGLVCYMLKSRKCETANLTINDALSTANAYLLKLGIKDMVTTYYETYENICTINFASSLGDTTVYTDLIKVSVALDNGEITGYDARGYIVNHTDRIEQQPSITSQEARKKLSPLLDIKKTKTAIIPSEGENEVLCYEFQCESRNGTKVLVYINASDGTEEQILLVFESQNGILTI